MTAYPILCMDCGAVTGHKDVEKSTTICGQCLDIRYSRDEGER